MSNRIFINASDSASWSLCLRRAYYDYHLPEDHIVIEDRFEELVKTMGMEHEKKVLNTLGPYEVAVSAEHTMELMAQNTPLIYQGTLVDEARGVICMPDFLILDDGQYRADDAKLASTMAGKKAQIAQIGTYDIVLGSDRRGRALMQEGESYELTEKDLKTAERFIEEMSSVANSDSRPDANFTMSKCEGCPYERVCVPEFKAAGNLGLDSFVDNRAVPKLAEAGISTLSDLAAANSDSISEVPYLKNPTKRRNAILQAQSLLEKRIIRLSETREAHGTSIHFDIETWPFGAEGAGTVYLWGFLPPPYRPEDYEYVWADDVGDGDKLGWMSFLNKVEELRARFDDATLIHYTNFELVQIRRYAERYDMEDNSTVRWILDDEESCFDIKEATSDSLILPITGYGLKKICKNKDLVNFQWQLEESGSQWSVVRYAYYLALTDSKEKEEIKVELLTYNEDDVLGTRALEVWLAGL